MGFPKSSQARKNPPLLGTQKGVFCCTEQQSLIWVAQTSLFLSLSFCMCIYNMTFSRLEFGTPYIQYCKFHNGHGKVNFIHVNYLFKTVTLKPFHTVNTLFFFFFFFSFSIPCIQNKQQALPLVCLQQHSRACPTTPPLFSHPGASQPKFTQRAFDIAFGALVATDVLGCVVFHLQSSPTIG